MAEEPTKKAEEKEKPAPPKKKSRMKWLLIGAGVLMLVGGAVAGGIMMKNKKAAKAPVAETEQTVDKELASEVAAKEEGGHGDKADPKAKTDEAAGKQSMLYKFDDKFVVNLVDPRGRIFLQMSLQLAASSPKTLKMIQENVAPLRDVIIMLLSTKTREDIDTAAGKERFKRELLARIDGLLEPKAVSNVYLTDWLVINN